MKRYLLVLLLAACSCKKETSVKGDPTNTPTPTTPTTPTNPGSQNCNVTKADAENIAIFPADNAWNLDISNAPIDPFNAQIIAQIGANSVKADFGSGLWQGKPIGIPYVVVCGTQPKITVNYRADSDDGNYGDESDAGPFPIPADAPIEGNGVGDAHVIAVDVTNKKLYELYNSDFSNGVWNASSGAIFDLTSNALRPDTWTSADAAGLPIWPGLVRYEEVLKGEIDHAIRFTLTKPNVKPAYIHPARHKVNSTGGQFTLPFGAKLRLKASFDVSSYPPKVQIILNAMKKYGIILADIGSNMYITGAPDERWNNNELQTLGTVKASDFEVVKFN